MVALLGICHKSQYLEYIQQFKISNIYWAIMCQIEKKSFYVQRQETVPVMIM